MGITIQPKRVFEGQIIGAVDTPAEALIAEQVKGISPKDLVDRLISGDDGHDDLAPGKGVVAQTFAVMAPTDVGNASLFLLSPYNFATTGYNGAGEAGAFFKYDAATKKPIELQVADRLGNIKMDVKYKDGELVELVQVQKSAKFPNNPVAIRTIKLTVTGEGEQRVTKMVVDAYGVTEST